jgi:hypothetical protein
MKLVIIESPYNGNWLIRLRNKWYARRALRDCYKRREAGYASHLLYTQILSDKVWQERNFGIAAGLCWGDKAELTAVYKDYGYSSGMRLGIFEAQEHGRPIEERTIGKNPTLWDWIKGRLRG